jgi:hypothetical protein
MAYFVVERSREDGTLHIPLPEAYETREEAIAALSAATGAGTVSLDGEVFIADLGAAVPVLVMQPAAATAPAEPEAGERIAEPVEEPADLAEAEAEGAFSNWEPLAEIEATETTLADALKRAASSLEGEGIIAPESVQSFGDVGLAPKVEESVEGLEVAEDETAEAADESEEVAVPEASEEEEEVASAEPEERAWPWANVESYEIKVEEDALAEEAAPKVPEVSEESSVEDALAEEIASLPAVTEATDSDDGAGLAEESPIITSAPAEGEEAYVPQPVILGDYSDAVGATEEADSDFETGPDSELEVEEPVAEVEPEAAAVPEIGYEATGELKLEEYTCQDCVYSNTCPKVGQTTPAECGSFQWRSA